MKEDEFMNIETANRLLKLRKEHNLSQEDLAQKLNISRQAVSKWERAEASPDTDKLIDLAELYGVSIDELLTGSKETVQDEKTENENKDSEQTTGHPNNETESAEPKDGKDKVSFKNGIHVRSANGDIVDIGLGGIHISESGKEKVHIGFDGIRVSEEEDDRFKDDFFTKGKSSYDFSDNDNFINIDTNVRPESKIYKILYSFPFPLFAIIAFVCGGIFLDRGWTFSWLSFLTIPLYYTTISAIKHRNLNIFCYPVLVLLAFFGLGIIWGIWGYSWLMFLTIPFYYWISKSIRKVTWHF